MITFLYCVVGYFAIGFLLSLLLNKWAKEENVVFPEDMSEWECSVIVTFTWLPFLLISILFTNITGGKKDE